MAIHTDRSAAGNGRPARAIREADTAGPLSITPGGEADAPSASRPREAEARSEGSVPSASPPAGSTTGGYAVQISSQRSEAGAQATLNALQTKYPQQLGSQHGMVRRADLGPKGIYYRALVGPFASAEEASQLCSSLKAAGGACIVQRN
jgi:cell division septation protein DedD